MVKIATRSVILTLHFLIVDYIMFNNVTAFPSDYLWVFMLYLLTYIGFSLTFSVLAFEKMSFFYGKKFLSSETIRKMVKFEECMYIPLFLCGYLATLMNLSFEYIFGFQFILVLFSAFMNYYFYRFINLIYFKNIERKVEKSQYKENNLEEKEDKEEKKISIIGL